MLLALLLSGLAFGPLQAPPAADAPPAPLTELRSAAVAVYAPALAGDWEKTSEQLSAVDTAVADLPSHLGKADLVLQLRRRVRALHDAVRDRRGAAAAVDANWIARIADEIASAYETRVPADARLLAFFGREIEIDAHQQRRPRAKTHLADLRTVWRRVEPMVLRQKGVTVARQFTDALAGLDGAVRHGDLARAADAEIAASEQVTAALRRTSSSH